MLHRRPRPHRLVAAVAATLALGLGSTSCSDDSSALPAAGEDGDGAVVDDSVLSGEATTVGGETIDLGDLAGKDLVVWFWAPW